MGRGTNGTRGPMLGALSDKLKIIKEIKKEFLKNDYIILRLVTWKVSHREPDANQVGIKNGIKVPVEFETEGNGQNEIVSHMNRSG